MITSCLLRQEWKTTSFRFERELITGFCLFLSVSFHFQPRELSVSVPESRRREGLNGGLGGCLTLNWELGRVRKQHQDKCSPWQLLWGSNARSLM